MGERIAPPRGEKKEESSTCTLRAFLDPVFLDSGYDVFANRAVVLDFFEVGLSSLLSSPGVEAVFWTGSLARHCLKPQHSGTNWDIKHAFEAFLPSLSPDDPILLRDAASDLSTPDQDLDVVVKRTSGQSLYAVYTALVHAIDPSVKEKDPGNHRIAIPCPSKQPYTYIIEHGVVPTNPSFQMIILRLQDDASGAYLAHIDVSQMPETTEEALSQRRHGGMTILTQDLKIPLSLVDGAVSFQIPEQADQFLNLPERIETEGKSLDALVELAMRSLRMRLIHTPEQFDPFIFLELPSHMHTNALFELRAAFFSHSEKQEVLTSPNALKLFVKELMICAYLDPFTTTRFLKDTGLALVIPGMRDMTQEDWRNWYSSSKMKLVANETHLFQDMRYPRNLRDLDTQRQAFIHNRREHNGFARMLLAYGDAMHKDAKDIRSAFTSLFSPPERDVRALRLAKIDLFLKQIEASSTMRPVIHAIVQSMTLFPTGLTEKEIQTYVEEKLHVSYTNDAFRAVLRVVKQTGVCIRQGRSLHAKGLYEYGKRQVSFYTLRYARDGINLRPARTVVPKDMIAYIASLYPESPCMELCSFLAREGLCTKEAMQTLSRNDFSDLYAQYEGPISAALFFETLRTIRSVLLSGHGGI